MWTRSRYSVYLLYWYKRTHSDVVGVDSLKFVVVMVAFAVGGFIWSLAVFLRYHVTMHDLILNVCDVVTIGTKCNCFTSTKVQKLTQ